MATTTSDTTLRIATQTLALLDELAGAAQNLAERSLDDGISATERVALRNQAKVANEQAGALLARGAVDLFGGPPGDAAQAIDAAIAGTQAALARIKKVKAALELVAALVGVAGAVLAGDWQGVLKSFDKLAKKAKAVPA